MILESQRRWRLPRIVGIGSSGRGGVRRSEVGAPARHTARARACAARWGAPRPMLTHASQRITPVCCPTVPIPRQQRRAATIAAAGRTARASGSGHASDAAQEPPDLLVFSFIVDDLVHADGATDMEQVGGGGPQTAWGAAAAAAAAGLTRSGQVTECVDVRVALAAGVGHDMPRACTEWLSGVGIDLSGMRVVPSQPTPRAWQLTEADGRRTQVWRTPEGPDVYAMLRPEPTELPTRLLGSRAAHVGVHPNRPSLELVRSLRAAGTRFVSVETFTTADAPLSEGELRELCGAVDCVSPNLLEARTMFASATMDAVDAGRRLVDAGAPTAIVRCGEDGAVLVMADGRVFSSPAASGVICKDPTGCGNAMMGAAVLLLSRGAAPEEALAMGTAVAAAMAEAVGVPPPPAQLPSGALVKIAERYEDVVARTSVRRVQPRK